VALLLILCRCLFSGMWPVWSCTSSAVCFFFSWPASRVNDFGVCEGSSALMWGCWGDFCQSSHHFS